MEHVDRFMSLVMPEPMSGCWLWLGQHGDLGYGKFRANKSTWPAHRFAYTFLRAPVSKELVIDHLCRNPACVNPDHLEPVTQRENIMRGTGPTAVNATLTHCKRGHPLGDGNISPWSVRRGWRVCRECDRLKSKRRDRKNGPMTKAQLAMLLASEPDDITGEEGCGIELKTGSLFAVAKALRRRGYGTITGPGGSLPGMYWNNARGLEARKTITQTQDPRKK